ncbi:MAG: acetate kinase [Oscillospiraceae bacterium]|nr:acetate kinase [Oscillospiraceae bacterium]
MKVLVINAGSSSLKYQLIDMTDESVLAKGSCERIGIDNGAFKQKAPGKEDYTFTTDIANHSAAIKLVVDALTSKEHGVIGSMSEIAAVGHRVLHGGEKFSASVLIDDKVIEAIEECCELGPLHNPHNLTGIRACEEMMPGVPQVAVFDTGFHQTMPPKAYMFGLPYKYYEKYRLRKYGFHGTSHRFVSKKLCELNGWDISTKKIITCHLGNGSSIAAVDCGKCVDTSMSFTPLDGLMMGTRSGAVDPSVVLYIMKHEGLSPDEMNDVLNKKSGFLGTSDGVTSDSRDLIAAAEDGNSKAELAIRMFRYQIKKYIGSYAAAMGGLDAVIFTGGIGENSDDLRDECCEGLGFMGIELDRAKNTELNHGEGKISTEGSRVEVWIVPTNEELLIARDTLEIVGGQK